MSSGASKQAEEGNFADTSLAGRLVARALEFSRQAEYDSSNSYFEMASEFYAAEQNWQQHVFCRVRQGDILRRQGAYDDAIAWLEQTANFGVEKLSDKSLQMAMLYNNLAICYYFKGAFPKAGELWQQALGIRATILGPNHPQVAALYGNLALAHEANGDYEQALACYNEAATKLEASYGPNHPDVASNYNNMGTLYSFMGHYDRAIALHEKAVAIWRASLGEKQPDIATAYNNIGDICQTLGDYEQARTYLQKALALWQEIFGEQHPDLALAFANLGNCDLAQGDYEGAIAHYNKALSLQVSSLGAHHPDIAKTYHNLGDAFADQGATEKAIRYYQRGIAVCRAAYGRDHPDLVLMYNNLGVTFRKRGEFVEAWSCHERALAIAQSAFGKKHPLIALNHNSMGQLSLAHGDWERALVHFQAAICANIIGFDDENPNNNPKPDSALSQQDLLASLSGKGQAFVRQAVVTRDNAALRKALAAFRAGEEVLSQMRLSYGAEGSKLSLAESASELCDHAIQALVALARASQHDPHARTAFQFAEHGKSAVLLEAMTEARAKHFAGIPDSTLERERQLRIEQNFYDRLLTEAVINHDTDSASVIRWNNKLFDLKQQYGILLKRFEQEYPQYYNLKYQVDTVSVQEVQQQLLDDNTALVEYFVGADSIFIFVIRMNDFKVVTVTKDPHFQQRVQNLRAAIVEWNFAEYTQSAYALYQNLLEPVIDKLQVDNLIIVPDGTISAVPFEALLTARIEVGKKEYSSLPYFVNDRAISYAYSATLLLQTLKRQHKRARRDYLAFAPIFSEGMLAATRGSEFFEKSLELDSIHAATRIRGYLPASRQEVEDIFSVFNSTYGFFERLFDQKSRLYLEGEASEDAIKSPILKDYRYLHFATHGFVNETTPKLSGLLLAQDTTSSEDGILYLGEIYNLDLNAELVTLSACETGLGQIAKGEGIIGLTRGFLYAGAANLLVSLWQVADQSTADLMVNFYGNLLDGQTKAEALRQAKLKLIQSNPAYAKPYYWAPFVLIGS